MTITDAIQDFPQDLQRPMRRFYDAMKSDMTASREDFHELRGFVSELAGAQERTELRVGELAEAQKRTETRVEELAEAQKRTETRVEELAEAQKRTEETMHKGFKDLRDSIAALGSRWGLQAESTFRSAIQGILHNTGYTVEKGYYGNREVDVIIKNGDHILLEITSGMKKSDIRKYNESAADYEAKSGITPRIMVAAIYIPPMVMREIADSKRKIEIFSLEEDE